jgi:hypothetical protein
MGQQPNLQYKGFESRVINTEIIFGSRQEVGVDEYRQTEGGFCCRSAEK